MKFIKLDLLTLLISLFLFASCESTSTIGLEVDPTNAIQGALVDTVTIKSQTIAEETVNTRTALRFPLGYLKDPIFGTTEASLAATVNLPNAEYAFGASAVLDSAVLILNYAGEFYGDSTATYSIDVHQLNENLTGQSSFLNNRTYPYKTALLGNKTSKLYPTTKVKVTDVVLGKADTVRNATPQIRIVLDRAQLQSILINSPTTTDFKSNTNFARYFNGVHVQINKTNSNGTGGIAFLNLSDANSGISVYYKKPSTTTTGAVDTVSATFPITAGTNPVAASINHVYSTDIATQLANPTVQYATTYLQPLGGLRNKISFPSLGNFAKNIGKIAINKAELVIDLSASTDVIPFNAAPRLALYRYDLANQRKQLPDNDTPTQLNAGDKRALGPIVFGGYFNPLTKQYVFVITSYVQDLLDGKTQDYGTFLAATPLSEADIDIFPSIATAARSVVGSYKKSPSAGDKVMKLNIYYTKIN
jgi:hypothetical protein